MIADDLYSAGNLVDAYFNYKEGLIHLVSALQSRPSNFLPLLHSLYLFTLGIVLVESDSSRKRIIRSKVSTVFSVSSVCCKLCTFILFMNLTKKCYKILKLFIAAKANYVIESFHGFYLPKQQ